MHSGFFPVWQQWTDHPAGTWLHKSEGIKEFLAVLGRRRKIIQLFVALGFLGGFVYAMIMPPLYEAQALIEVKPQTDALMSHNQSQILPPNESVVLSNVEVLRSRDVAEHVVKNLSLATSQEFWNGMPVPATKQKAQDIAVMRVLRDMGIKQLGRSLVVAVRYRHTDPRMAALVANGIIKAHQEQQIDDKTRQAQATQKWLSARLEEMSRKLRESAGNVERYRVQMDLVDGARAEITSQQLSDISAQLIKAKADYAAAQAKADNLNRVRKENKSLDAVKDIMQARMVEILSRDEAVLQAKMAELGSRYGANHPRMRAAAVELFEVRRKQKIEIERVAARLSNDVLAEKARVDALQKSMNELEEKRRRENEAAIGLRELERESEANKLIYEDFLKRYKRVSALADIQQSDIRIVSVARMPGRPSGVPSILGIVMGGMIGMALGLITALFADHLENGVRSSTHIRQATGKKVLATIPGKRPDANWVIDKPFEKPVEAIRILNYTLNETSFKTVAFTSLLAEESKVFAALSLARLKALSGKRVLLIDMDMRQAPLRSQDGTEGTLHDALSYMRTKQDIRVPSLSLLAGTPVTADELGKVRFDDIRLKFDRLKDSYDWIVMNVGDMAAAAEARDILTWADSSICVVRTDHTPIDLIVDATQYFEAGKKNFSGFVLAQA